MYDSLSLIIQIEQGHTVVATTGPQGFDELRTVWDAWIVVATRECIQHMVNSSEGQLPVPNLSPMFRQPLKRQGAAHFMQEMPIDMHQVGIVAQISHNVSVPDLIKKARGVSAHIAPEEPVR